MTTAAKVMQSVVSRGHATISHVIEDHPELSRDQVMKALQNAAQKGRLRRERFAQEMTGRGVRRVAVYVMATREAPPPRRVASVWELGAQP